VGFIPYSNTKISTDKPFGHLISCAYFAAVSTFIQKYQDGHLWYSMPRGFRAFSYQAFSIVSRLDGGEQVYFPRPNSWQYLGLYSSFCSANSLPCADPSDYYGELISTINGMPVLDYLVQAGRKSALFMDPSIAFNDVVAENQVGLGDLDADEWLDVTFTSNTSTVVRFYTSFRVSNALADTAAVITANTRTHSSSKRDDLNEDSITALERQLLARYDAHFSAHSPLTLRRESGESNPLVNSALKGYKRLKSSVELSSSSRSELPLSMRERQYRLAEATLLALEDGAHKASRVKSSQRESSLKVRRTATGTSLPVLTGGPGEITEYTALSAAQGFLWSYKNTTVIRLTTLAPFEFEDVQRLFSDAVNNRSSRGLDNNLIIDTTGNPGGYLCLLQTLLSYMIPAWSDHSFTSADSLHGLIDIRKSSYMDDLNHITGVTGSVVDPATGTPMAASGGFYNTTVSKTFPYAGHSSATGSYTKKFYGYYCGDSYWMPAATSWFDKILIVTDGRCSSSCAVLTAQLRHHNRIRIMTYGGIWGRDMDTSAIVGGQVQSWAGVVDSRIAWAKAHPTTADSSFTLKQFYHRGEDTPRQFQRVPADYLLPYWAPSFVIPNSLAETNDEEKAILAHLYESALAALDDMPSGLVSAITPIAPVADPVADPPVAAPQYVGTPTAETVSPVDSNQPTGTGYKTLPSFLFVVSLIALFF
jgi:hypothetical protein